MRRSDREIKETEEIIKIIKQCSVCSLALMGETYPYVIPLNFGFEQTGAEMNLYFHGAGEGEKMNLIKRNPRASFCMNTGEELEIMEPACKSTMRYSSVCGQGIITKVEDKEEKKASLACIMRQYDKSGKQEFDFEDRAVEQITILKLSVKQISGKSNKERK